MGDTWHGEEAPRLNRTTKISSRKCTRMDATWTHRSRDIHLTAVIHRGRGLIGKSRSSIYLRSIGRCRRSVEELHDRGSIAPRSRRDRVAIVERSRRNQLHDRRRCCREDLQRDRRLIDARSGHDRGRSWLIPARSVAKKCGNRGRN